MRNELAAYIHVTPKPGTTVGTPWSAERVAQCIAERKTKFVAPYRSLLRVLQSDRRPEIAGLPTDVWIVWEDGDFLVFFDPVNEYYGLAAWQPDTDVPTYWGVYGDLVYVLCAV